MRLFKSRRREEELEQPRIRQPRVENVPKLWDVTEEEANAYSEVFNFLYEEGRTRERIRNLVFGFELKNAVRDMPEVVVGSIWGIPAVEPPKLYIDEEIKATGFIYGIRGVRSVPVIYLDSNGFFESGREQAMLYREKQGLTRYHQISDL